MIHTGPKRLLPVELHCEICGYKMAQVSQPLKNDSINYHNLIHLATIRNSHKMKSFCPLSSKPYMPVWRIEKHRNRWKQNGDRRGAATCWNNVLQRQNKSRRLNESECERVRGTRPSLQRELEVRFSYCQQ